MTCVLTDFSALRLLMDLQVSIAEDNLLIVGDQPTLAFAIGDGLRKQGYAAKNLTMQMAENQTLLEELLEWASVILIAEHADKRLLLGREGIIRIEQVIAGKVASVGLISGLIETDELLAANLAVLPKKPAPQGYMAYSPSELGCFPVMNLFAAGVKVGQTMARAPIGGHGLRKRGNGVAKQPGLGFGRRMVMDLNKEENGLLKILEKSSSQIHRPPRKRILIE